MVAFRSLLSPRAGLLVLHLVSGSSNGESWDKVEGSWRQSAIAWVITERLFKGLSAGQANRSTPGAISRLAKVDSSNSLLWTPAPSDA